VAVAFDPEQEAGVAPARELRVYEAHAARQPVKSYLRETWRRRELALELSRAKVRAEHLDTAIGQLWLVLNPLLLAGVYFVLVDIMRRGAHPPGFFAHLVAGIFAYHLLSDSMRSGVRSIVNGNQLILNARFPRALLPLASAVTAVRRFAPMAAVYVPLHVLAGRPVGPELLWVLPLLALLIVMATGATLLVAALQVYFRDIKEVLPYALRVVMFTAPVLFLPNEAAETKYAFVLDANPLGQLLTAWSDVLYRGQAPELHSLMVASAWAVAALVAGIWAFVSREHEFAARL